MIVTQLHKDDSNKKVFSQWNEYVLSHPDASCYHQVGWQHVISDAFGLEPYYLYALNNSDEFIGVLPLFLSKSPLFGTFLTSVPFYNYGGILADNKAVAQVLLDEAAKIARNAQAAHIELRHIAPCELQLPTKTHKVRMVLDLPETPEMLWDSFKSKLRSQIRRAQKEQMDSKIGGLELLDDFYTVFSINMRDLGTPVWTKKIFHSILTTFPDAAYICCVYYENKPVAAGFLHCFKDTMEIPSASSLRDYNRLSPNMLLYWSVLEFACNRGYKKFDFGRSSPDAGTYKFKAQWGSEPEPLHWQYWLASGDELPEINPQNPKYQMAIAAWQKLPVWLANIIGPKISRNIP